MGRGESAILDRLEIFNINTYRTNNKIPKKKRQGETIHYYTTFRHPEKKKLKKSIQ